MNTHQLPVQAGRRCRINLLLNNKEQGCRVGGFVAAQVNSRTVKRPGGRALGALAHLLQVGFRQ